MEGRHPPEPEDAGIELYYLPSSYPDLTCIWRDDDVGVFHREERELAEGARKGNILMFCRVGEDAKSADRHIQARMNVEGLIRLT